MGPPSCMWSVVDRNVVMRNIPVLRRGSFVFTCLNSTKGKIVGLAVYCVCVFFCQTVHRAPYHVTDLQIY